MVLKQCDHLHFVPFYYGSAFHFISGLFFVSACFPFFSTWHKSQFGKISLHVPVLLICNWLANSNIFHFARDGVLDVMTQQEFQHKTDHGIKQNGLIVSHLFRKSLTPCNANKMNCLTPFPENIINVQECLHCFWKTLTPSNANKKDCVF